MHKFWLDSPDLLTEFPSISLESPSEYHSCTFEHAKLHVV